MQQPIKPQQLLRVIRQRHKALLLQADETGEVDLEQVRNFLKMLAQAGTILDNAEDRSLLQELIRYWSNVISDKAGTFPIIQLQPFDTSLASRKGQSWNFFPRRVALPETIPHEGKSSSPPTFDRQRQNRLLLLKRVRAFWINGVLNHSLHGQMPITLELHQVPDVLANPWYPIVQESDPSQQPLQPGTHIITVFDEALGELLILGEPGSGKTTLLLELAQNLLDRAEKNEGHPLPLIFNLSSWATKPQPLSHWLIEEMNKRYQIPHVLAQALIEAEQVLPLLDGLDEVASADRALCVDAINTYHLEHGLVPLVVCSRSEAYKNLSKYLQLSTAVTVLPLTLTQVETYLAQAGSKLSTVDLALREDPMLLDLASNPLMLNTLIVAYAEKSTQDLLKATSLEERRKIIFAAYIEQMLHRRRFSANYSVRQTKLRLAWLARQMKQHNQTIFSIEEIQADWLPTHWSRLVYHTLTGFIFGVVIFLAFSMLIGAFIGLDVALRGGLTAGAIIGAAGGLSIGLRGGPDSSIQPSESITFSFESFRNSFRFSLKRVKERLFGALIFGMFVGFFSGLFIGLRAGRNVGLNVGLGIGLIVGLFVGLKERADDSSAQQGIKDIRESFLFGLRGGLIDGMRRGLLAGLSSKTLDARERITPNEGIWRSAQYAGIVGSIFAIVGGVLFGVFGWVIVGSEKVGVFILSGALSSGLFSALIFGGEACTKHIILRLLLWLHRTVPWNYSRFLDYVAECILLRKVGGSYLFIHQLLLEYFSTLPPV